MAATRRARRHLNFVGFAIAAGLFGYALFAQLVQGYEACPLCMFQRFAMIGVGVVFLTAALRAPLAAKPYAVLAVLAAATGAGISGWHLRLQYLPPPLFPTCGPGTLGGLVERFGYFDAVKRAFTPTGDCADINWELLGLSMPGWVLLWFIALGVLAVAANWKTLRA